MRRPLKVVVVGAGIGGLGAALVMARAGHRVTIIERDDTPMPPDPESAFDEWDRRGAPQVRHPHVFLGLARVILRERFPDVLAALAEIGIEAPEVGTAGFRQFDEATLELLRSDDDIRMLPCRRTTFEWVMRRTVLAEPEIELRLGLVVAGVDVDASGGPPAVTGVRLKDGTVLDADLVIATTGRRGNVPAWLAEHGIEIPETASDAGVVYFSRFYRTGDGSQFGFRGGFGAGLIAGVVGSDAGTYSITAVVDKNDKELRAHLSDSARFDATMRLLPELADVAAADGVPIYPVHCMAGLINRTRSYTHPDGTPRVQGLLACGDAHTCTNPAYGRGQSLALRMATMIADAVAETEDLGGAARLYEFRCKKQIEPWYHFSVYTDEMRARAGGTLETESGRAGGFDLAGLARSGADPHLIHSVMRVLNLLDPPRVIAEKMAQFETKDRDRLSVDPAALRRKRPTRDELLGVVA